MGLFKSRSGVPWTAGWQALAEADSRYYADRLVNDWMKDNRRVQWANAQKPRTRNDPKGLMLLMATTEWIDASRILTESASRQGPMTARDHGRIHYEVYRSLRHASFDDWAARAERYAAVLESGWEQQAGAD